MTCIVGVVDKKTKRVTLGGDSAGVSSFDVVLRKDAKVFKNNDFVIGCTSSFRMIQLLRFSFTPPEIKSKDIYDYMCTDFINAVRTCFKDGGYLQKETDGDEKGGIFLVGYKNRLFRIECDFQVGENLNGFDSVGCGAEYALGALFVISKSELSASEKVLSALKTAAFFSGAVRPPFVLNST